MGGVSSILRGKRGRLLGEGTDEGCFAVSLERTGGGVLSGASGQCKIMAVRAANPE